MTTNTYKRTGIWEEELPEEQFIVHDIHRGRINILRQELQHFLALHGIKVSELNAISHIVQCRICRNILEQKERDATT